MSREWSQLWLRFSSWPQAGIIICCLHSFKLNVLIHLFHSTQWSCISRNLWPVLSGILGRSFLHVWNQLPIWVLVGVYTVTAAAAPLVAIIGVISLLQNAAKICSLSNGASFNFFIQLKPIFETVQICFTYSPTSRCLDRKQRSGDDDEDRKLLFVF